MPNIILNLSIFAVKSISGAACDTLEVSPKGPRNDRRFMLVDENGTFLTARKHHVLLLIRTCAEPTGFRLSFPGKTSIFLPFEINQGDLKPVSVWADHLQAQEAGREYSDWFSSVLGMACRLVFIGDNGTRPIRGMDGEQSFSSFADSAPILFLSRASLDDLNQRLAEPVSAAHFRPNVLVSGETPYAENNWQSLQIGGVTFKSSGPCSRCILTTVDPLTAQKSSTGEPLKTLAGYRKTSDGVVFGQYMYALQPGVIRHNDVITNVTFHNPEEK